VRALEHGFTNVFVMVDGIEGWEAAQLPVETATGPRCAKIRGELEYTPDPAREGYWYIRDPFWGRFLSFNDVQVEMMRALDGTRAPADIRQLLGDEFGIEISVEKIESFTKRLERELLLDDPDTQRAVERILQKPELSVHEVHARLGEPNLYIIDLNGEARWKRSHLPGALLLNPYHFEKDELPGDVSVTLVFYCTHDG